MVVQPCALPLSFFFFFFFCYPFPSIFKGHQGRTRHLKSWGALPVIEPHLQLTWFRGHQLAFLRKKWDETFRKRKKEVFGKKEFFQRPCLQFLQKVFKPFLSFKCFSPWLLKRKENSSWDPCWLLEVHLRCRTKKRLIDATFPSFLRKEKASLRLPRHSKCTKQRKKVAPPPPFHTQRTSKERKRLATSTQINHVSYPRPGSGILTGFPVDRRWKWLGFCLGHDVIPRTPTLKAIRKQPQRQGKEKHTPQSFSLHPFNNETELSYVLGPTNPCPTHAVGHGLVGPKT